MLQTILLQMSVVNVLLKSSKSHFRFIFVKSGLKVLQQIIGMALGFDQALMAFFIMRTKGCKRAYSNT